MFRNLARHAPASLNSLTAAEIGAWACVCGEVDAACLAELKLAGIGVESGPHEWLREKREVPFGYIGVCCRWSFRRAWYYWVAEGPGVPADKCG